MIKQTKLSNIYQNNLELIKGSKFVFDYVPFLYLNVITRY